VDGEDLEWLQRVDGCRHKGDPSDQMAGAIALIDTGGIQIENLYTGWMVCRVPIAGMRFI
jgi:hypothetical protein